MGKALDGIVAAGCAMVLAGTIGAAVYKSKADDNQRPDVARAIALENVLDEHSSSERGLPEWRRQKYALMEKELAGLKNIAYAAQDKEAYEGAKKKEAWFIALTAFGYTLSIAGLLRERANS